MGDVVEYSAVVDKVTRFQNNLKSETYHFKIKREWSVGGRSNEVVVYGDHGNANTNANPDLLIAEAEAMIAALQDGIRQIKELQKQ